jgi:flagellar basal body-associated protein FliL
MKTTPPGWYDDGHGALRWWDGTQWTEHVAQPDAESSPAPTEAEIVAAQLGFEQQQPVGASETAAQVDAGAVPGPSGRPDGPAQPAYPAAQQYPPAAPGYPQGMYPGAPGAPAGGGFTAATEPRKSKLWIVWVVLGVVLLGIVIAAAVVIPLLFLSATSSSSQAGGAQSDDERSAVATVELYDEAWQDGDCETFTASTTEDFRTQSGFTDCVTFEEDSVRFDENFEDYEVTITDVETLGDEIAVTTNETFTALVDANGEPADPSPGSTVYYYTLVQADGAWVIDDLSYE